MAVSNKCSSCKHFLKMKGLVGNSGLCTFHDARTSEDHKCKFHKGIKFNRKNNRKGYK